MKNINKLAYTLAEVVIVMLIISVIVGIGIKISKLKTSKITPINYYSAYSTLKNVNAEMLKDFKTNDDYLLSHKILKMFLPPVFAQISEEEFMCEIGYSKLCTPRGCSCVEDGSSLPLEDETEDVQQVCPVVIPCGKQCDASTNYLLKDISGFSRTCSTSNQQWSETKCACIPTTQTLPRKGENYCKLFANYTNTIPSLIEGGTECKGDSISDSTTSFNNKKPDVVLRNGMYLYNMSQNPVQISILQGNSNGTTYTKDDGSEVDIDEWGYTIYVDIDGKNSDGVLWEDVFPFYVTLSGIVVPGFSMGVDQAGGANAQYLQTSISDEYSSDGVREINWITKGKSFKESACKMGYLKDTSSYCKMPQAYTQNVNCTMSGHDCRFHYITPIKFF
jgi:hypothetical protein